MRWTAMRLIVTRRTFIHQEEENGEWATSYEIVRYRWTADIVAEANDLEEDAYSLDNGVA
jgi:hypothetical protein